MTMSGIPIIGVSPATKAAMALAERFAPTSLPIFLVGATGTGKELFARHIHHCSGRRGQLVDVNCGALPQEIAESLLFGHRRGAFTGAIETVTGHLERAHSGTLFLDEVLHLSLSAQVKLLRALETGEVQPLGSARKNRVDFRIVSAAQRTRRSGSIKVYSVTTSSSAWRESLSSSHDSQIVQRTLYRSRSTLPPRRVNSWRKERLRYFKITRGRGMCASCASRSSGRAASSTTGRCRPVPCAMRSGWGSCGMGAVTGVRLNGRSSDQIVAIMSNLPEFTPLLLPVRRMAGTLKPPHRSSVFEEPRSTRDFGAPVFRCGDSAIRRESTVKRRMDDSSKNLKSPRRP